MKKKVCGNCKYYVAHYVISGVHLLEVEGHCMKHIRKKDFIGNIEKLQKSCEKWETAEEEEAKREKNILDKIQDIKKRLTDIALILTAGDIPR